MSTLFMVGTPIGNLDDISFRAVQVLRSVDAVAAEDTRRTLQLLTHFNIKKPIFSCRAQNERSMAQKILDLLDEGKSVAYASDAGTPSISDPGAILAQIVQKSGHSLVPIPGACAFVTLASVAGQIGKPLVFEGFLSPKSGRRKSRLLELMNMECSFALYESPFRILKLLRDIADIESERCVIVGRELTKLHEEIVSGSAKDVLENFCERQKILGEFVVLVASRSRQKIKSEKTLNF